MYTSEMHGGVGAPGGTLTSRKGHAAARVVRHFTCADAERQAIATTMGRAVTASDLRAALEGSIRTTAGATLAAAAGLRRKTRVEPTLSAFREAFGLSVTFVPSWRPANQRWDVGDVVRHRLERAAEILAGGSIRFTCTSDPGPGQVADGTYDIRLGLRFWDWVRAGNTPRVMNVLLGAALRIDFGPRLGLSTKSLRRERVSCYGYFVVRLAGLPADELRALCAGQPGVPTSPTAPSGPAVPGSSPAGKPIDLFPKDVLERIVGGPETLDQRLTRIIREAPPGQRPKRSLADDAKRAFDSLLNKTMDRVGIPDVLRPYVRRAAHEAIKRGSDELFDRAMDSVEITGEAREATKGVLDQLWQRPR